MVIFVTYWNSLDAPFIFDDSGAIVGNPTIRHLWPIGPALFGATFASVAGRPLLNLSFAINYAIGGTSVRGYHISNILFHIAASLALFGVIRRTFLLKGLREHFASRSTPFALIVTLLWALHPLQTESVTYIVQRGEAMVGFFYLFTLYCVIRASHAEHPFRWELCAVVSCLLGMATKEVMATAPPVIFLYDSIFITGSWRQTLKRRRWLYVGLACSWFVLAGLMLNSGKREGTAGFGLGMGVWEYARIQFVYIMRYLRLVFCPDPLVLDYGMNTSRSTGEVVACMLVIVALLAASVWALITRHRELGFLGLCFFLILAPTSSIVPLPGQVAAEHRMYLPLACVIVLLVIALHQLTQYWRFQKALPFLPALAVVALGFRTMRRNSEYQHPIQIWEDVVAAAPNNARGFTSLGASLFEAGRFSKSIEASNRAIELEPRDPISYYNRGTARQQTGDTILAIADFTKTIELMPRNVSAYINRGSSFQQLGQIGPAARDFTKAIELAPDSAQAYYNRGSIRQQTGNLGPALDDYSRAIELRPDYVEAYNNRGLVYQAQRKFDLSHSDFNQAIQLRPGYASAYANRGVTRLLLGQYQDAIDDFTRSISLDPDYPNNYSNRAVAYYYLRNYAAAWKDVARTRDLGGELDPKFLQDLTSVSGRPQ
jgi:tetratricopeptide (TPR) repeat protein